MAVMVSGGRQDHGAHWRKPLIDLCPGNGAGDTIHLQSVGTLELLDGEAGERPELSIAG